MLRNPRHERFAQGVARGERLCQAYVAAGFSAKGAAPSASRLLRHPEVGARVEELRSTVRQRSMENAVLDQAWVLQRLKERVEHEPGMVGLRALELMAKILGLCTLGDQHQIRALSDLTKEEMQALVADGEAVFGRDAVGGPGLTKFPKEKAA